MISTIKQIQKPEKFILPSSVGMYKNVNYFLEKSDRRSFHYKKVVEEVNRIEKLYGNASKELYTFFLMTY